MKKIKIIEIILHIIFWTMMPLIVLMQDQTIMVGIFKSSDPNFYYAVAYGTIFNMIIFYIATYIILPYYFSKKKYLFGVIFTLLYFVFVSLLEGAADYIIISNFYFPPGSPEIAERIGDQVFAAAIFMNIPFILIVFIYRISKDWYKNERIKQILKEEKLKSELQFLKSQINPHFLFNTLNNLFGIARKIDAMPVADGIAKLSHLMRYMLYDSEVDFVTLEKEVNYLNNYIDLQKLRIESVKNIHLSIKLNNYNPELKIAPLILIPFVENAFKHGISIKEKSEIEIELKTNKNIVEFRVSNTINKLRKNRDEENSGFGLKNVQKRLDLLYPERYSLNIKEDTDNYSVSLSINTQA